jgi:hypothetical protein|tara:strand:- start:3654 stop:3881 length:228 start_codon:yes stop_codon:yes gene_type:complete
MNDNIFGDDFRVVCADGVTREGCSLTIYKGAYAYLDSNGELLDGERAVTQALGGAFAVSAMELAVIVQQYGPLNR